MATTGNNKRDVRLGIEVDVGGDGAVRTLAGDLKNLGTAGSGLPAAFTETAAALDALTANTRQLREAEAAARTEFNASKTALAAKRDELSKLKITSDATTRGTADHVAAERALKLAIVDGGAALRTKRDALTQASAAARSAAVAETALRTEAQAATAAYRQLGAAARTAGDQQVASGDAARKSLAGIGQQLRTIQQAAAAVIGGQFLGGLVGDLAKTSDAYANLAARIKLVTGEGTAFETAFDGVRRIALATNTSLESTGTLFARVATAGREVGLAQADALLLTESINQAVQLSGSSAQASDAAVTQLIQGLQSGVLRGQEFNSVMEQAPRLAKALADGLGVTTGELRALAIEGELTSGKVIAALQGQSAALSREFDQLPSTIGRAITNLSSAWTVYIGEASSATGASATVADAINLVSKNLDTLAALLVGAGKAAIAFKAVRIAQEFLAITTAARVATAEVAAFGAAQTAANVATAGTAATVGRFASLVGSLKLLSLVGVLTNLQDIGTAIGEGAARLLGYGKAMEDLERAERAAADAARANAAAKSELAQKTQLAADASFGLTAQSRKLVGEFVEVTSKGGDASTALDKVTKALELGSLQGVQAAGIALDDLARKGLISGAAIRDSLGAALKNEDLGVFRVNALAAFDASENGARRLKAAIDAIATESLRRAGTSLAELTTGYSTAATAAINDVDALAESLADLKITGDDAGRALASSLDKALAAASTERAVAAVEARFEALGRQGLISGDQMAAGLAKAQQKADELRPGINSLGEALAAFGLKTRGELQATADRLGTAYQTISTSVQVSLADQRKAFEQWAAAAIAANGGVESSAVQVARAMLEIREAALSAGRAGAEAGAAIRGSFESAAASIRDAAGELRNAQNAADSAAADATRNRNNASAGAALGGDPFFALLAKKNAGSLSADDLAEAQAVFANFKHNLTVSQTSPAGTFSFAAQQDAQAQYRQALAILEQVKGLAAAGAAPAPAPISTNGRTVTPTAAPTGGGSAAPITKEVRVVLEVGGRTSSLYGSSSDVSSFLTALEAAKRSAGLAV